MIIKTPTRSYACRRKSKGLNRSGLDCLIPSSESRANSNNKSQTPYLIDQNINPQLTLLDNYPSKKTVCSKQRTHSTKASKHTRPQNLSSFEINSQFVKKKKKYSYLIQKKQKWGTYDNLGYSKDVIEQLMHQRKKAVNIKKNQNDQIQKLIRVLEVSRQTMRKRKTLIEHSRVRLNESWKAMCGLLNSHEVRIDHSGDIVLPRAVDFLVREQLLLQNQQQALENFRRG